MSRPRDPIGTTWLVIITAVFVGGTIRNCAPESALEPIRVFGAIAWVAWGVLIIGHIAYWAFRDCRSWRRRRRG